MSAPRLTLQQKCNRKPRNHALSSLVMAISLGALGMSLGALFQRLVVQLLYSFARRLLFIH